MKAYVELKKSLVICDRRSTCQPAGNSWEEQCALKVRFPSKLGLKDVVSTHNPRSIYEESREYQEEWRCWGEVTAVMSNLIVGQGGPGVQGPSATSWLWFQAEGQCRASQSLPLEPCRVWYVKPSKELISTGKLQEEFYCSCFFRVNAFLNQIDHKAVTKWGL